MGKKRKWVSVDTSKIEFDPEFFDGGAGGSESTLPGPETETAGPGPAGTKASELSARAKIKTDPARSGNSLLDSTQRDERTSTPADPPTPRTSDDTPDSSDPPPPTSSKLPRRYSGVKAEWTPMESTVTNLAGIESERPDPARPEIEQADIVIDVIRGGGISWNPAGGTWIESGWSESERPDSARSGSERPDSARSESEQPDSARSESEPADRFMSIDVVRGGGASWNPADIDSGWSESERRDSARSESERTDSARSESERTNSAWSESERPDSARSESERPDSARSESEPADDAAIDVSSGAWADWNPMDGMLIGHAEPESARSSHARTSRSRANAAIVDVPEDDLVVLGTSDGTVDLCGSASSSDVEVTEVKKHGAPGPAKKPQPRASSAALPVPRSPPPGNMNSMGPAPVPADDASSRKRARKEESMRRVTLVVESLVPGIERQFEAQRPWTQSLFDLRDEFGAHAVLVHNGNKKPWFYSPKRISRDEDRIAVQILSEQQWEERVREAELDDPITPSDDVSGDDGGAAAQDEQRAEDEGFVIALASKTTTVRAMVGPQTTVRQLLQHFCTQTSLPATRVMLDGDALDANDTIGELEIEADDKLDIH